MNKKQVHICLILLAIPCSRFFAQGTTQSLPTADKTLKTKSNKNNRLMYVNWHDEKLVDIINRLASQRKINLILPLDQKKLAETMVTFTVPYKITLARAWQTLEIMLDIAGYAVIEHDNMVTITTKSGINQKPMPLFLDIPDNMLPNIGTFRYVYSFQNLRIKDKGSKDNLQKALSDLLPGDADQGQQLFLLDENFNTLLINANASVIKGVMPIIRELDQNGFREDVEVVPLFYTSAREVGAIIDQLIPKDKNQDDMYRFPPMIAGTSKNLHTFFSSSTRVVQIEQTNSVAIFGPYDSVQRVKKFIKTNLDIKLKADRTVLHVRKVRYLNAEELADTLTKLIEQKDEASQSTGLPSLSKLLSNVIIVAEKEQALQAPAPTQDTGGGTNESSDIGVKTDQPSTEQGGPIIGGNNLIIAATQRDWNIITSLIDAIDIEPWQIALEVLIVDITFESSSLLSSQLRRIMNDNANALHNLKWQSAQTVKPALDFNDTELKYGDTDINTKAGLESDLLSQQPPATETGKTYNIASSAEPGTTVVSFKDNNGVALILSLLQTFDDTKILAKPFVIAKNNQTATILSQQIRMVPGSVEPPSMGGTAVVKYYPMRAALKVNITPRISTPPNNINLDIRIDADEFQATTVITKRTIATNANVGHKEILVLGGISKAQITDNMQGVPLLCHIPIIGNLFKQQSYDHQQRNLLIFVSPVSIPPASIGAGTDKFTRKKLNYIGDVLGDESNNFVQLQDPISNFLFHPNTGKEMAAQVKNYQGRQVAHMKKMDLLKQSKTKSVSIEQKPAEEDSAHLKKMLSQQTNPFAPSTH